MNIMCGGYDFSCPECGEGYDDLDNYSHADEIIKCLNCGTKLRVVVRTETKYTCTYEAED